MIYDEIDKKEFITVEETKLRKETPEARSYAQDMAFKYNNTLPSLENERRQILKELFGSIDESGFLVIETPFQCDLGYNIHLGKNVYANHNLQMHDHHEIRIGDNVMIGPNCTMFTIGHPLHPQLRRNLETAIYFKPITIHNGVWIGANVVILPGVTIGEGSVIAANSMISKDIPAMVVAGGSPCRIIRDITDEDLNNP